MDVHTKRCTSCTQVEPTYWVRGKHCSGTWPWELETSTILPMIQIRVCLTISLILNSDYLSDFSPFKGEVINISRVPLAEQFDSGRLFLSDLRTTGSTLDLKALTSADVAPTSTSCWSPTEYIRSILNKIKIAFLYLNVCWSRRSQVMTTTRARNI